MALSVKTYRYKNGGETDQVGLIAQQVEQIDPLLKKQLSSTHDEDGHAMHLKSLNYGFFTPASSSAAVQEIAHKDERT